MPMIDFSKFFILGRLSLCMPYIDIESLKNRLLKVCDVPATSGSLPMLLFFAAAIYSTNEANKADSTHS